ncbi:molybdopterin-dependent oxidoreductase [Mucilaginibacter arboris]|uniref:Molybdopterin-dependent oxidoreductase n=1 Tax=Mucilaginibacter arboris TaxID=2682090 RepID=A0A7K1T237_9SPHI|nr:molybdopterin-dependent oxidoreductase [Mucilaginibacter arboris]MVN23360.1 molybdopterin-dependent oxidoreductase [Mucilaginibacter arboris]
MQSEKNKEQEKGNLTEGQKIRRRTFISFFSFIALNSAAYSGWRWLYKKAPEEAAGITAGAKKPLRRALNKTELAFRKIFSPNHFAKTYPKSSAAKKVRVNGDIGLGKPVDTANWKLKVVKTPGEVLQVSLEELKALPKTEIIFDFKCVEGWDQIQHWAGVKLMDFIRHYHLEEQAKMEYAGLVTPDKEYYVGIDMPSFLHPQTILAYEMNDQPLRPEHGAPVRLIIPVKYGIKNLKNIASISFSNNRPPDYWAEQGYDYYSGL